MMKTILLVVFAFTLLLVGSCTKDVAPVAECPDEISFSQQIEPFIALNCSTSGCHDATASGGIILNSHTNDSLNADNILIQISNGNMPIGGPLVDDSIIKQFNCWINQGRLNN